MTKKKRTLRDLFPMIKTREEVMQEIRKNETMQITFSGWTTEQQEQFLDWCSGARGHRMLYDIYFKRVFHPEYHPENLTGLLEAIMGKKIDSFTILSQESGLIDEKRSLMVMDILVLLKDGTRVNVEVQKIGYDFPGERAACYSADLLLRQYQRLGEEGKKRTYADMKPVITIVFIEESIPLFHENEQYIHHYTQQSETGLPLHLLQEYYFVPLDIFRQAMHDKPMETRTELEAWLTFLTAEDPEEICDFLSAFPEFEAPYKQLYTICKNVEVAMGMFSESLRILDENTTKLMIDEMKKRFELELEERNATIQEKDVTIQEKDAVIQEKDDLIEDLRRQLQQKQPLQQKEN